MSFDVSVGVPASGVRPRVDWELSGVDTSWVPPYIDPDESDVDRRAREVARVISQLRRALQHAEVVLAEMEEERTTYFVDRSGWIGD